MRYTKKELSKKEVLQKLASYCAYQERCLQEVNQKLFEYELAEEEKNWVIESLISENFIDELRFARTFCRSKFTYKKWGRNKIRFALRGKGIENRFIDQGLKEIVETDYLITLEELLAKKKKALGEIEPFALQKKLYAYAVNKGYEAELVHTLLGQLAKGR